MSKLWTTVKALFYPKRHDGRVEIQYDGHASSDPKKCANYFINQHADAKASRLDESKLPNQGPQPVADYFSSTVCVKSQKGSPTTETLQQRVVLSSDNSPFPSSEDT